jgi:hypothetical protein
MDQLTQNLLNAKLTRTITDIPNFYHLTPQELEQKTNIAEEHWRMFLDQEQTRQLIHRRITEDTEIAQRKAMQSLAKEAQRGNVQAIKELNQLSGILNQNNNKQFITHYIPRPATKEVNHDMPKM